ncbi:MAG: hypothetical protein IPM54_13550 [Polyangiaceae bacterium]|nr:hypothetical protein [Polyangiaceae bacterium]
MIPEYFQTHASRIGWGLVIFGVSLVVSLVAAMIVILRLPEDYFLSHRSESFWTHRPRWQRLLGIGIKNVVGVGLVMLGLFLSLPGVPGQGLLTMFIGIVLLDLPGKRAIERRIIATPAILSACNRMRARFGKPPLRVFDGPVPFERKALPESIGMQNDVHGRVK